MNIGLAFAVVRVDELFSSRYFLFFDSPGFFSKRGTTVGSLSKEILRLITLPKQSTGFYNI